LTEQTKLQPMKLAFSTISALAGLALGLTTASAAIYNDNINDGALVGAGGGILDIVSVEVNNTATDLIFKINLVGNPVATDWGKYMIGITSGPGGDPAGNGWVRPIGMSSGMNYWLGTWVDSGNGAENRNWTGAAWNLQSATYGANPDGLSITKDASSVTLTLQFAGLGLAPGSTFLFDVYTSGGGGTDGAVDALANPGQTIANWSDYYNSGQMVDTYTLSQVPEPGTLALLGLSGLLLAGRGFRRNR
jgi:hypothetical protein